MLEFQKLTINRFMSFGEKQVVPLADQGLIRLEGDNRDEPNATSNMAGKSTIIEALLWCLFGRTARGLKHDQVVNRFEKKNCYVSVSFTDEKLSKYTVRRYRRHSEHKNHLHLWKGDRLLSFRHDDETQRKLESILGCDFQSFVNSVIFGGLDLIKPFARLTDSEQKKLLESFLHFEQFDMALRRTKDLLTELREKHITNQLLIEQCRGKVASIRERIRTLRKSTKLFRKEHKQEFKEVLHQLKKLREPKQRISEDEVNKAESRATRLSEIAVIGEEKFREAHSKLKRIKKALHNRKKLIGKTCPACGQLVKGKDLESFLQHLSKERNGLKEELRNLEHAVVRLRKEAEYGARILKRLRQKHNRGRLVINQHLQKRKDLETRLSTLRKRLSGSNPFAEQVQKQLFKYGKQSSNLLLLEQKDFAMTKRIKDLEFWETGFGNQGVKALIIRQSLPSMNRKLKEYGKVLFRGGVELEFKPVRTTKQGTERELFHLHYKSKHGASSYLGESSGGRRRTDVCVLLVFSWLSRICNILLIDEILDGLDDGGRKSVLEILSHLRRTVIVISHEKGVKEQLSKVWVVTKHHGISTVET